MFISVTKEAPKKTIAVDGIIAAIKANGGNSPYNFELVDSPDFYLTGNVVHTRVEINESNLKTFQVRVTDTPPQPEKTSNLEDTASAQNSEITGRIYPRLIANAQSVFSEKSIVYKVRRNYDLKNCVLEFPLDIKLIFEGGSFSNGILKGNFEVVNESNSKIFDNIKFEGNCVYNTFNLDWFVSYKNDSILFDKQFDTSDDIQSALDSGVTKLFLNNKSFYYVSKTLKMRSWVGIDGNKINMSSTRSRTSANPCIYTDIDNAPVLEIEVEDISDEGKYLDKATLGININNLYIRRCSSLTATLEDRKEEIPTILIKTGKRQVTSCWKLDLNVFLYSEDKLFTLPSKKSKYFPLFTGIEVYASNNNSLSYINIDGKIFGFKRAYYCHKDLTKSWITDTRLNFDSNGERGGLCYEGAPFRITGSHQSTRTVLKNSPIEYDIYFDLKGSGFSSAIIWDINQEDEDNPTYKSVTYSYKAGDSFVDSYNENILRDEAFNNFPQNFNSNNTESVWYKFMDKLSNRLESIFTKVIGNNITKNDFYEHGGWRLSEKGIIEHIKLKKYSADGLGFLEKEIDLNDSNTVNFSKIFKFSSYPTDDVGNSYSTLEDATVFLDVNNDNFTNYEVSVLFNATIFNLMIEKFGYLMVLTRQHKNINQIIFEKLNINRETQIEKVVDSIKYYLNSVDLYYSPIACIPFKKFYEEIVADCNYIRIIFDIDVTYHSTSKYVLPKVGIMTFDASNIITSSGGEISNRLALGDVVLVDYDNFKYFKYVGNKYFKKYNLSKTNYVPLVVGYFKFGYGFNLTINAGNEIINVTVKNGLKEIVTNSKTIDVKFEISSNAENENIFKISIRGGDYYGYVDSLLSQYGFKFLPIETKLENPSVIEYIAPKTSGDFSKKPIENIYVGFEYYCNDLNTMIIWDGVNWVDSNGTIVDNNYTKSEWVTIE